MKNAVLTFDQAACKGCKICLAACPQKILELDTSRVNAKGYNPAFCVELTKCTACAICAKVCPDSVIKVEVEE